MCSNYRPARDTDLSHFGVLPPELDSGERDAFPGTPAPMIYQPPEGGGWSCVAGIFGLLPVWAKDQALAKRTYNARAETVAEKPSFRSAWQKRQLCIVPAQAIYEPNYETGKAVWWRISRADGAPMAIAGLWERKRWEEDVPSWSFTMLTVNADAHPLMRRFHKPGDEKRTVVVLDAGEPEAWLTARSEADMRDLLKPCDAELLVAAPGRL